MPSARSCQNESYAKTSGTWTAHQALRLPKAIRIKKMSGGHLGCPKVQVSKLRKKSPKASTMTSARTCPGVFGPDLGHFGRTTELSPACPADKRTCKKRVLSKFGGESLESLYNSVGG